MAAERGGVRRGLGWPAAPFAWLYRLAVAGRNAAFDAGWRAAHQLDVPVISVGNLTAGGTGKTPAVEWVVRALQARERRPAVLLRGYGAAARGADGVAGSDETVLLRENLPGVPIVADPDRVAGGRRAIREGADVLVCDDAFQHRRLARDLDWLCVDATDPFGGGHLLPWGLLREPARNARRAHAILITRADAVEDAVRTALRVQCHALLGDGPVVATRHAPSDVIDRAGTHALDTLGGVPVFVISGVGNPAAVSATVADAGARVVGARAWPDHHAWSPQDLTVAAEAARAAGATALCTTQKDWVKLRALPAPTLPLRAVRIALEFLDDPAPLAAQLDATLTSRSRR